MAVRTLLLLKILSDFNFLTTAVGYEFRGIHRLNGCQTILINSFLINPYRIFKYIGSLG